MMFSTDLVDKPKRMNVGWFLGGFGGFFCVSVSRLFSVGASVFVYFLFYLKTNRTFFLAVNSWFYLGWKGRERFGLRRGESCGGFFAKKELACASHLEKRPPLMINRTCMM